jgi:putative PIN family toxin of toxin-antitoxin system
MRVCIDATVLISYLLRGSDEHPPGVVVNAGLTGRFDLILNEKTLIETRQSISSKPYLSRRILEIDLEALAVGLALVATVIPETASPFPAVTRDPGDDYLIAHAVLEQVDYLVTGDKDLLVLGEVAGVQIVSPAGFVAILEAETGS